MRFVLVGDKIRRSLHLSARILKVYMRLSQGSATHTIQIPNSPLISQGSVLENASHCRNSRQKLVLTKRGGMRNLLFFMNDINMSVLIIHLRM